MNGGYYAPMLPQQVDGTALTTSTVETSILAAGQKITLANQWFSLVGDTCIIEAAGRISTLVTSPGTLNFKLKLGSTTIADGGTMVLSTTAKTNVAWYLRWLLTLRASGATANVMHQGIWTSEAAGATTVAGEAKSILLPQSAPAVGANFDASSALLLDLTATWSVSNAANSVQCHQFIPIFGRAAA